MTSGQFATLAEGNGLNDYDDLPRETINRSQRFLLRYHQKERFLTRCQGKAKRW